MELERVNALKRIIQSSSEEEAKRVIEAYEHGEKTGYGTLDRPWDSFYSNIKQNDLFLNTTPYQGLVLGNKDYPNEKAIEYFGANITYGDLFKNIDIVAKSLKEYGVKKGDYVTICSTTTPEVVYLFYALSKIGAVANIISPFYTPEELMARINECESQTIIMVDQFLPKFKDALNKEKNKNIVVLPLMNSSILRFVKKGYKVD